MIVTSFMLKLMAKKKSLKHWLLPNVEKASTVLIVLKSWKQVNCQKHVKKNLHWTQKR